MVRPAKLARCGGLGGPSLCRLSSNDPVVVLVVLRLRAQADRVPAGTRGSTQRMARQLPGLRRLRGEGLPSQISDIWMLCIWYI